MHEVSYARAGSRRGRVGLLRHANDPGGLRRVGATAQERQDEREKQQETTHGKSVVDWGAESGRATPHPKNRRCPNWKESSMNMTA